MNRTRDISVSGFAGIAAGRISNDSIGTGICFLGILVMLIPGYAEITLAGLILTGLGCAPIYPCLIHVTQAHFGEDKSQVIIGAQMAVAYTGILVMPSLFGAIANKTTMALLPVYLFILLVLMFFMHEKVNKI